VSPPGRPKGEHRSAQRAGFPIRNNLADLIARAEGVLARVESLLPPAGADPDWRRVTAARWRKRSGRGYLQPVAHPHSIRLDELVAVDQQRDLIDGNTRQFVAGLPANNVLLTGSRGTGKSSLVKAMLGKYAGKGLRLIEVDKADLVDLPDIAERVEAQPFRFMIFCDDLTFDAGEAGYKALKVMLDGSVAGAASNVLVYATSNRRHLLPEYFIENLETKHVGEEVHPGESVEEKISLSERFGLWISFYPFSQDDYLAAVATWLEHFGIKPAASEKERETRTREALQWALQRGSRSGRAAWQFAKNHAGAKGLKSRHK
jgi:predicted AAA+ superfamily ATPase